MINQSMRFVNTGLCVQRVAFEVNDLKASGTETLNLWVQGSSPWRVTIKSLQVNAEGHLLGPGCRSARFRVPPGYHRGTKSRLKWMASNAWDPERSDIARPMESEVQSTEAF